MSNLPTYLQNRAAPKLNEAAIAGLGMLMPPHISIRGNTFTLIDATGSEIQAGPQIDVCIADVSEVTCKKYYDKKWEPDSNDPPVCWSANGLAPSRDAMQPQSQLCASCPQNVRGSAVSAISGVAIKACRDEKWLALLLPAYTNMRFQLVITPGSFDAWRAHVERCRASQTDLSDIVTRITFQPKVNGVLQFQASAYIDENTYRLREQGYKEKAFDVLTGRTDVPRQVALPGPTPAAPPAAATILPASPAAPIAFAAPAAPFANIPQEQAPVQRRKRRTNAEIAAAAQGTPTPAVPAGASNVTPPMAPFLPGAQAQTAPANPPTPQQNNFGIQQGVAPNTEIQAAINSLFAPQQ